MLAELPMVVDGTDPDFALSVLEQFVRLSGETVCRQIRASARGERVPILILTGLNDTESIERAYGQGATDFITKPINWTLLSHRVRYALRVGLAAEVTRRSRESLARAQNLARMGNWAVFSDGRIECSAEQFRIYGARERDLVDMDDFARSAAQLVVAKDRQRVVDARLSLFQTRYEPGAL